MFTVRTVSNGKVYTRQYAAYIDAYLYAGQLPHYCSVDCVIEIIDNCTSKVAGAYDKVRGWKLGTPVLYPF